MDEFSQRLQHVHEQIAAAAARAGRTPEEIELVAVSKTHPPAAIRKLLGAGQLLFGESRVQETVAKARELPSQVRWHFIGHLQKNKVRLALPLYELLHSVDSVALAEDIDRLAGEIGGRPKVLLEVNLTGEGSKFGFSPAQLRSSLASLLVLSRTEVQGLMTIPPPAPEGDDSRARFRELRELRDQLEREFAVKLPVLSMGMSSDFTVAVEEGATHVRVGTALFGGRTGKTWKPEAAAF